MRLSSLRCWLADARRLAANQQIQSEPEDEKSHASPNDDDDNNKRNSHKNTWVFRRRLTLHQVARRLTGQLWGPKRKFSPVLGPESRPKVEQVTRGATMTYLTRTWSTQCAGIPTARRRSNAIFFCKLNAAMEIFIFDEKPSIFFCSVLFYIYIFKLYLSTLFGNSDRRKKNTTTRRITIKRRDTWSSSFHERVSTSTGLFTAAANATATTAAAAAALATATPCRRVVLRTWATLNSTAGFGGRAKCACAWACACYTFARLLLLVTDRIACLTLFNEITRNWWLIDQIEQSNWQ